MGNDDEILRQNYNYASDLMNQGISDHDVKQSLINRGVDDALASSIVFNLKQERNRLSGGSGQTQSTYADSDNGGGFPSWVLYIGGLILINILSAVFGWGFWLY
jgi:hypothetical protein